MDLREIPPIDSASFFKWKGKMGKKLTPLPNMDEYLGEEGFAEVFLAWFEGGIKILVVVDKPFETCSFPDVEKGDGLEIFIDTKALEDALVIHKYCHHFIFLPKEVDGLQGAEVTTFRGEDRHSPADPEHLQIKTTFRKKGYEMEIVISEISLFGYDDPKEQPWIGFAFRLHQAGGKAMHFPLSFVDLKVESHPSLWAKLERV